MSRRAVIKRAKIRRVRLEELRPLWFYPTGLRRKPTHKIKVSIDVKSFIRAGFDFAKPNSDNTAIWLHVPGREPVRLTEAEINWPAISNVVIE